MDRSRYCLLRTEGRGQGDGKLGLLTRLPRRRRDGRRRDSCGAVVGGAIRAVLRAPSAGFPSVLTRLVVNLSSF